MDEVGAASWSLPGRCRAGRRRWISTAPRGRGTRRWRPGSCRSAGCCRSRDARRLSRPCCRGGRAGARCSARSGTGGGSPAPFTRYRRRSGAGTPRAAPEAWSMPARPMLDGRRADRPLRRRGSGWDARRPGSPCGDAGHEMPPTWPARPVRSSSCGTAGLIADEAVAAASRLLEASTGAALVFHHEDGQELPMWPLAGRIERSGWPPPRTARRAGLTQQDTSSLSWMVAGMWA